MVPDVKEFMVEVETDTLEGAEVGFQLFIGK